MKLPSVGVSSGLNVSAEFAVSVLKVISVLLYNFYVDLRYESTHSITTYCTLEDKKRTRRSQRDRSVHTS